MKCKFLLIMSTLLIMTLLTGCISDESVADETLEKLTVAIEERDEQKIKEMISPNTIDSVNDIDMQIQELIDFFQGEVKLYKNPYGGPIVSKEKKDDNSKIEFDYTYLVETTKSMYWISIYEIITDEVDKSNEGIKYIYIKETQDNDVEELNWGIDWGNEIGIHIV